MSQLLSQADLSNIKSIIGTYVGDLSLGGVSIMYKMTGTTVSTWSPTTALIPDMYTAFSGVSAFRGSYDLREVEELGGLVEIGDCKMIFLVSGITGTPSVDDQIYEAGTSYQSATTYQVKYFTKDPNSICYFMAVRAI